MKAILGWVRPLFFVGAFAVAAALVTPHSSPILAQGASFCETNYPGDPYCHDDLWRELEQGGKVYPCRLEGCHTAKAICCLKPDT